MWEGTDFTFSFGEEAQPDYCAFSLRYRAWAMELVRSTLAEPNHIAINQAKVMLLDKYYEWKTAIPRNHRRRHLCILDVLDEAYQTLKAAELALTPPQLYLPAPSKRERKKKEPPDEPTGSILGELMDF
jgi:hypothetical protein